VEVLRGASLRILRFIAANKVGGGRRLRYALHCKTRTQFAGTAKICAYRVYLSAAQNTVISGEWLESSVSPLVTIRID